jgi:hypothetical protein
MTNSNQFLAIAKVCTILSQNAATPEESESFARSAIKWREYAARATNSRSAEASVADTKKTPAQEKGAPAEADAHCEA